MNITTPIIIAEGWDVRVYRTVSDAEKSLEPVDINAGIYKAYDAEGRFLILEVIKKRKELLKGAIRTNVESVRIHLAETDPKHKNELRDILINYLDKTGTRREDIINLSIEQLVQELLKS